MLRSNYAVVRSVYAVATYLLRNATQRLRDINFNVISKRDKVDPKSVSRYLLLKETPTLAMIGKRRVTTPNKSKNSLKAILIWKIKPMARKTRLQ